MRVPAFMLIVLGTSACGDKEASLSACVERMSATAGRLPLPSSAVDAIWTFDLSKTDETERDRIVKAGITGQQQPTALTSSGTSEGAVKGFGIGSPGSNGSLLVNDKLVLLRVPGGQFADPVAAIKAGCERFPGTELRRIEFSK